MDFHRITFLDEIEKSRGVLIAGAGGGYDVFSGLPIYFYLRKLGIPAMLSNLTFSDLSGAYGKKLSDTALIINADSGGSPTYFPERYLCQWLRTQGMEVHICCFQRVGPKILRENYRALCDLMGIDTVVLVDGGTDSLMRGDEVGLGTPQEDIASIAAVNELSLERKILLSIGFGVDAFHGVNHYQFLEAVSALNESGHFLGSLQLLKEMEEVQMFRSAYEYVADRMPFSPSIVTGSILAAIDGRYGDFHSTTRTEGSKLWINPLMSIYWGFWLSGIADRCLYYDKIKNIEKFYELELEIERFRASYEPIRTWQDIPV